MKIAPKILAASATCAALLLPCPTASAKEAKVTQIIHEVKLLPENASARDASLNDKVSEDTGVRTGGDSRSELTFPDLTITRLGANTIFSFQKSGRTANVDSGSILLRVPKDSGGGTIRSSAVTVSVTGTTVIFEGSRGGRNKLYTLEGSSRAALKKKPGDWRKVPGGQMLDIPPGATTLPMPQPFDVNQLMRTHPLITDFKPLPSEPLIREVAQQSPPPPPPTYNGPNISIGPNVFPLPIINQPPGRHRNPTNPTVPPRTSGSPPQRPPGTTTTNPPKTNSAPTPTPPPVITRTNPKPTSTPSRVLKKKPQSTTSGPR